MTSPGPRQPPLPSKGEINRCGDYLVWLWHQRSAGSTRLNYDRARATHAISVVNDFRAAHSYPLVKVTMGLRQMVAGEGYAVAVTQRLKRTPRIIRKLDRMGNSNLARLEDIGGCRAVLPDGQALERVARRVLKNWGTQLARQPRDYIAMPKEMGYRALHLVHVRDGRPIEVQLRTRGQQDWAEAVEAQDAIRPESLKDGDGPPELVEYFVASADMIYMQEYQRPWDQAIYDRFVQAREAVVAAGYYRR